MNRTDLLAFLRRHRLCVQASLAGTGAEAVTRLSDRPDPVPDDVWKEAARHYDEPGLAALLLSIASINVWNRLNVATRQVAGSVQWDASWSDKAAR